LATPWLTCAMAAGATTASTTSASIAANSINFFFSSYLLASGPLLLNKSPHSLTTFGTERTSERGLSAL
jgi:hypothetical protein